MDRRDDGESDTVCSRFVAGAWRVPITEKQPVNDWNCERLGKHRCVYGKSNLAGSRPFLFSFSYLLFRLANLDWAGISSKPLV